MESGRGSKRANPNLVAAAAEAEAAVAEEACGDWNRELGARGGVSSLSLSLQGRWGERETLIKKEAPDGDGEITGLPLASTCIYATWRGCGPLDRGWTDGNRREGVGFCGWVPGRCGVIKSRGFFFLAGEEDGGEGERVPFPSLYRWCDTCV